MTDANVAHLEQLLRGTQKTEKRERLAAEQTLKSMQSQPKFAVVTLHLVSSNAIDMTCRQAGSILFKNFVKKCWDGRTINVTEKNIVKQHILDLMCTAPRAIMVQISESLRIIADSDFPQHWKELLPGIIEKLKSTTHDLRVLNGVLETANAIFKRFRYVEKSDTLFIDLSYILTEFQEPMLHLFTHLVGQISSTSTDTDVESLGGILAALRTLSRIFYSLNWQDLPEYFEDHIGEWMKFHLDFLGFSSIVLEREAADDESSVLEKLQSAIIENVSLYAEKYEDEFQPYMQDFTHGVWTLLTNLRTTPRFDIVTNSAMKFLTSIVKKSWNKTLFEDQAAQIAICEKIVVQNIFLRDTDIEDFEDNPIEYLRRDIEGSDTDSRRRGACDLVQGLCVHFENNITSLCSKYINSLLEEYASNPLALWKKKDAAITLVLALSAKGSTRAHGATSTNELIDVIDFMSKQVVPELESLPSDGPPILKADAIKFCTIFRHHIPAEAFSVLIPLMSKHLASGSYVVHTYAAAWIERILAMKIEGVHVILPQVFGPHMSPILSALLQIINTPGYPENEYLMKAVMRGIGFCCSFGISFDVESCVTALASIFRCACLNPSNPQFNHYMFESISSLLKFGGGKQGSHGFTNTFETAFFAQFMEVLQKEIDEFVPYVFQIFAQMLELKRDSGVPDAYLSLFAPILTPDLWMTRANVPSLVLILSAYLKVAPKICTANVIPILGCWQSAYSTQSTEIDSFDLLIVFITCLSVESFEKQFPHVVHLLVGNLMGKKKHSIRFKRKFFSFFMHFIAKHGHQTIAVVMNSIEQNLFLRVLAEMLASNVENLKDSRDLKVALIAVPKLLVLPEIRANIKLWVSLLSATTYMLTTSIHHPSASGVMFSNYPESHSSASRLSVCSEVYDAFPSIVDIETPLKTITLSMWNGCMNNAGFYEAVAQLPLAHKNSLQQYIAAIGLHV
jgi:exportin-2 (importin alpha re-exporter)